ncbi:hypothetical protein M9H77_28288 [Catharanthus roseus]|uniref:Uncharacterized protein n=1 Tax=Catharanthus roseus TaxID=4058 RepID=A0ACC0AGU7_CATRO|nr:hypothetical protein M9H77_28288 [Catharanthus roseus]
MEFSLTTTAVETDSGNRTKKMTEAEQMNGHRADERSPSNSNAASRRREEEDRQGTETQRTAVERGAAAVPQKEKVEELEKSSIRTQRDRRKYNEETVKRRRGRDCTRNEEARV